MPVDRGGTVFLKVLLGYHFPGSRAEWGNEGLIPLLSRLYTGFETLDLESLERRPVTQSWVRQNPNSVSQVTPNQLKTVGFAA